MLEKIIFNLEATLKTEGGAEGLIKELWADNEEVLGVLDYSLDVLEKILQVCKEVLGMPDDVHGVPERRV